MVKGGSTTILNDTWWHFVNHIVMDLTVAVNVTACMEEYMG